MFTLYCTVPPAMLLLHSSLGGAYFVHLLLLAVEGAWAEHGCTAPPFPRHGNYTPLPIECGLQPTADVAPGDPLASACVLLYTCENRYTLADVDVISICEEGRWIPDDIRCRGGVAKEDSSLLNTVPDENMRGELACTLPSAPASDHSIYCPVHWCNNCHSKCRSAPGSHVTYPAVRVQCAEGHRLQDDQDYAIVACVNGTWDPPEFPKCLRQCQPLQSNTVFVSCWRNNGEVSCDRAMLPGTNATFKCRPSHTEYPNALARGDYSRPLICHKDGRWSSNLFECIPMCGVSKGSTRVETTVVNGKETKVGVFPWHAGLYIKNSGSGWKCICGGSLINTRVVLTAAHCVSQFMPEQLRVALGKYYRAWDHDEETAVKKEVLEIRIPKEYSGGATSTYLWDIALLLLTAAVPVNNAVMPVCRAIYLKHDINRNKQGYVVGWGKTAADGLESEVLLHSNFTIIDNQHCKRKIPPSLSISFDKFCGSGKGSVSVAEHGDSGGGVTTVYNDQHFVIGIVSVKINNLSVFTNVSYEGHRFWIDREMYRIDTDTNRFGR